MLRGRLLGLLHAPGVAGLGVDGAAVQVVRAGGEDVVDVAGVGEGHEPEAARPPGLSVLHHHAVDHLAETPEVAQQGLLRRVPAREKKFVKEKNVE